jgi:hypothetical protein
MLDALEAQIQSLDLTTEIGRMIASTQEFQAFNTDTDFIQETLNVLASDNLINKKNYFMDNQVYITDTLSNLHNLLQLLQDNVDQGCTDPDIDKLVKVVGVTINQLERGIDKFNQELTGQVSSHTKKDEVLVTEDTIKEAMHTNENTMQIAKDLQNPNKAELDEKTAQIQKSFQELTQQKRAAAMQQQRPQRRVQQNVQPVRYLIASQDLQEVRFVQQQCNKEMLNNILQNCGIDDARVFELKEVPTKKKTIQKTVTVIG